MQDGALEQLEIVPMQLRRLRLAHASSAAKSSLHHLLDGDGRQFHTRLEAQANGAWLLRW
jgi:hypothetical protein